MHPVLPVGVQPQDPGVGQELAPPVGGQGLEGDALLEVQQVELELVGAVALAQAVDDDRDQVGLALPDGPGSR